MAKKKTIFQKSISVLLCIAMLLSVTKPWTVMAEGEDIEVIATVDDQHSIHFKFTSATTAAQAGDQVKVEIYLWGEGDGVTFDMGTLCLDMDPKTVPSQPGWVKDSSLKQLTVQKMWNPAYDTDPDNPENPVVARMQFTLVNNGITLSTSPENPTRLGTLTFTVPADQSGSLSLDIHSLEATLTMDQDGNVIDTHPSDFGYSVYNEETKLDENYLLPVDFSDQTNITYYIPATNLSIQNDQGEDVLETTVDYGSKASLKTSVTPEKASVPIEWSSSDENVLTVSDQGVVTPVKPGDATITAQANNQGLAADVSDTCLVHVKNPLKSIELDKKTAEVGKDNTTELTVSYTPAYKDSATTDDKTVVWSVPEGKDVVSVETKKNEDGSDVENNSTAVVTGLKEGSAKVQVEVGKLTAVCDVTVKEIHLDSITLDKSAAEFAWNNADGTTLEVSYDPEETTDNKDITWTVSGENSDGVLNVTPEGENNSKAKVTANKPGTATVTATVAGTDISASCEITVKKADLASVTFPSGATITYGQALKDATFTNTGDTTQGSFAFNDAEFTPNAAGTFTYKMTFTPTESDLYNTQEEDISVTVNPKRITVQADDKEMTYGEQLPSFTYQIIEGTLAGDDTQETLSLTLHAITQGGIEVTQTTVQAGRPYSIVLASCTNTNYAVSVTPGALTVNQAELENVDFPDAALTYGQSLSQATLTGDYSKDGTFEFVTPDVKPQVMDSQSTEYGMKFTPTDKNYKSLTENITVAVNAKKITVTAENKTRAYGVDNPEFTYKDTDLAIEQGDELELNLKAVVTDTDTPVTSESPVGRYSIVKDSCTNTNYEVNVIPGTLEVTKAKAEVTFPGASLTYGAKLKDATLTCGSATYNGNDVPGTFAFENGELYLAVGQSGNNCAISFIPSDPNNYETIKKSVQVTVNPAKVTVTPEDASKDYLAAVPKNYEYTAEGMVLGEDPSVLKATFAAYESYSSAEVNTLVTDKTDAGEYAIIGTGSTNPNYEVTFETATLTIHKIEPEVTFPSGAEVEDGQALKTATYKEEGDSGDVEGTFAFNEPEKTLALGEDGKYPMTFTPSEENQKNYESVEQDVDVKVVPKFIIDSVKIKASGPENWRNENPSSTLLVMRSSEQKQSYQDFTAEVIGEKAPDSEVTWSIATTGCAEGTTLEETTNDAGETVERLSVAPNEANTTITLKATSVLSDEYFDSLTVSVVKRGDFNGDGKLDAMDATLMNKAISKALTGPYNPFYDISADAGRKVNAADLTTFLKIQAGLMSSVKMFSVF